jgi:hypothetical protein
MGARTIKIVSFLPQEYIIYLNSKCDDSRKTSHREPPRLADVQANQKAEHSPRAITPFYLAMGVLALYRRFKTR